jgi:glycosyltransferase involved in cell wall biosynthesis
MIKVKICHLTSVHHRHDVRIFSKELGSLEKAGYEVTVIVADGKGSEKQNGYNILDIGKPKNRIKRIIISTKKVYKKALEVNAEIYHFHDPELLMFGQKLKKRGKKVIYDVHEDVPRQILRKYWIPKPLRKLISSKVEKYENHLASKMDYIITATPFIRDRFLKVNKNTIDINNFPILETSQNPANWIHKKPEVCYIGSLTKVRGMKEMVNAFASLENVKLNLAGNYSPEEFRDELTATQGWERVNELGFVNRTQAKEIMDRSLVGLVTLHPIINYIDSLPVKMFEYMGAGIPVIASDFPLWKEIVEKNNCGICVDPNDPRKIQEAIMFIINNQDKAKKMGENGFKLVNEKFNWENEKIKLMGLYKEVVEK